MTRKFFMCFPLRAGNIVFGYIVIIISVLLIIYNLYCLTVTLVPEDGETPEERFRNWGNLDRLFGQDRTTLVKAVTLVYYCSYVVIALFLLLFSALFVCGVHNGNLCLVSTFFCYSFLHLFLTIGLVVWEATSYGYIQLGLVVVSDVLLITSLFGVSFMMEAIRAGRVYSRPGGEESYKYY